MIQEAIEKLEKERKNLTGGRIELAMKDAIVEGLSEFCRQNEEFAQAVVQGGNLQDCLKAVAKGVTTSISGMEAYGRAVRFYFPGAEIRLSLSIDLGGSEAAQPQKPVSGGIAVNLIDFLDPL